MENNQSAESLERSRRLEWFRKARFGMFIHWGLYSIIGRHEWVREHERWTTSDYAKIADLWHPEMGAPRKWAKLAAESGCKYMVMTTKHHEGFCLWDSALTDFCATKKGPGRDLVAEYVEACREYGLKVGLYYSLLDWNHPDGIRSKWDGDARKRFIEYTHGLIRELLTNYGKIDILWYDVPYPLTAEEWESEKMNRMVLKLQPDIIYNNRNQTPGDFGTPEQHIVAEDRMWEACMTTQILSWGHMPLDGWRTPREAVDMLRQVAAGCGNLLLNIGPKPDGSIPAEARNIFEQVGAWLKKYGDSIFNVTDPVRFRNNLVGMYTMRDNILYFHVYRWPGSEIIASQIQNKVKSVRFMNGGEIKFRQTPDQIFMYGLPETAPDPLTTVIEIEVEGKPEYRPGFHDLGGFNKLGKDLRPPDTLFL
ncbi:MAG: alpha-L-fucosidase [Victivallales bacterium]|jgi:alpha-L-fucosidase